MNGQSAILAVLPIDGAAIVGPGNNRWTVQVDGVTPPSADHSRWRLDLRFEGQPEYRLSLVVHTETVYERHEPGDPRWVLDYLRTWLFSPDLEKSEEVKIQP
jgi:hypothetical protein